MKHTYKVSGMTCNGCRNHVEATLKQVEGVSDVEVDLEKEQAVIGMERQVPLEKLRKSLRGSNYSISMPEEHSDAVSEPMKHTYSVYGMTCNGSRNHVEATLKQVEGVSDVEVDLEKEEAVIAMEKYVPLEAFQKKLKEDGGTYSMTTLGEKPEEAPGKTEKDVQGGSGFLLSYAL